MKRLTLENILNNELNINQIKDYCPNGLQIEGKSEILKIITGVSASQALIDIAIKKHADAILVHHGYFWKGEAPQLKGMKQNRIKALLEHDINLLAYHLPLDVHPEFGNNICLANLLGIEKIEDLDPLAKPSIALRGTFTNAISAQDLSLRITKTLQRTPFHSGETAPKLIKNIAWCTGAAQDYLEMAAERGLDAFITGEVSERTILIAREMNIHFFAAGHHATERYGIKALGEWLKTHHALDVEFIDIDNPI